MSEGTPPNSPDEAGDASANSAAGNSAPKYTGPGPGASLAQARKNRGLSQEEVGDSLNLAPHTVEWLETDNYDELPAAAFTQGYLRNYAKLVGIDSDEVCAAYQATAAEPEDPFPVPPRPQRPPVADLLQKHPGVFLTGACFAVGVLVLALLIAVWPDGDSDEETEVVAAEETTEFIEEPVGQGAAANPPNTTVTTSRPAQTTSSVLGATSGSGNERSSAPAVTQPRTSAPARPAARFTEPVLPSAASQVRQQPAQPKIDPNDPLAHIPIAKTFPVPGGTVVLVSDDDPEPVANTRKARTDNRISKLNNVTRFETASRGTRRLTTNGSDTLNIQFREDCWFEVKTVDGDSLFATLAKGGGTLNLIGEGPFRLVFGYAFGVQLRYNAVPVDVVPFIRNDVASLVVGQ